MKKKTMVLGGLIAAVAITGYSVAGTYAKYVSSSSFNNSARVARWNLGTNEVRLFTPSYGDKATSLLGDNIVAPGTEGAYEFSVAGTSEVKSKFSVTVETGSHSINESETDGYDPLLFKLTKDGNILTNSNADGWVTFADLKTALGSIDTAGTYKIEWMWEFGNENPGHSGITEQTDAKDTALGEAIYKAVQADTAYKDAAAAFKTADKAYTDAKTADETSSTDDTKAALKTAKENLDAKQTALDTARANNAEIEKLSVVLYVTVTAEQIQ